jgi:hypothetical protein
VGLVVWARRWMGGSNEAEGVQGESQMGSKAQVKDRR